MWSVMDICDAYKVKMAHKKRCRLIILCTFQLFNTTFYYCILQVTAAVITVHVGKNQLIAVQDNTGTTI